MLSAWRNAFPGVPPRNRATLTSVFVSKTSRRSLVIQNLVELFLSKSTLLSSSAHFVHDLFEGLPTPTMPDGVSQPATEKRFKGAFLLFRRRLVRFCAFGADA